VCTRKKLRRFSGTPVGRATASGDSCTGCRTTPSNIGTVPRRQHLIRYGIIFARFPLLLLRRAAAPKA
jgi:hypothetical protein